MEAKEQIGLPNIILQYLKCIYDALEVMLMGEFMWNTARRLPIRITFQRGSAWSSFGFHTAKIKLSSIGSNLIQIALVSQYRLKFPIFRYL